MSPTERTSEELTAFDAVGWTLYAFAALVFAVPTLFLASGVVPPDYLNLNLTLYPTLTEERSLKFVTYGAVAFVTWVYMRNYVVMHSIDNRNGYKYYNYYFVNYINSNCGLWGISYSVWEKIFRFAIIIWVTSTAVGTAAIISDFLQWITQKIVIASLGLNAYENLNSFEKIFNYYGFILFTLFMLFTLWDLSSIFGIASRIKDGDFDGLGDGTDEMYRDVISQRNLEYAIPDKFRRAVPVYSIIAYMYPLHLGKGELFQQDSNRSRKIQERVEQGSLFRIYWGSKKFFERLFGLLLSAALFFIAFMKSAYAWVTTNPEYIRFVPGFILDRSDDVYFTILSVSSVLFLAYTSVIAVDFMSTVRRFFWYFFAYWGRIHQNRTRPQHSDAV